MKLVDGSPPTVEEEMERIINSQLQALADNKGVNARSYEHIYKLALAVGRYSEAVIAGQFINNRDRIDRFQKDVDVAVAKYNTLVDVIQGLHHDHKTRN